MMQRDVTWAMLQINVVVEQVKTWSAYAVKGPRPYNESHK